MLALTFANPEDYEKIQPSDKVDILGLETFQPGKDLTLVCKHADGSKDVSVAVKFIFLDVADRNVVGNPPRSLLQRRPDRVVQGWFRIELGMFPFCSSSANTLLTLSFCRWLPRLSKLSNK